MKVGLHIDGLIRPDGNPQPMTGIQNYTDSLLTALSQRETPYELSALSFGMPMEGITARADAQTYRWLRDGKIPIVTAPTLRRRCVVGTRRFPDALQWRLRRGWNTFQVSRPFHLLHLPNAIGRFTLPLRSSRLIGTIYDMTVRTQRETHLQRTISEWETFFRDAQRRFARVITVSEHAKTEIHDLLGISLDRIDVTPLAPRAATHRVTDAEQIRAVLTAHHLTNRPFILYTGTLEPRKNLLRLVEAFAAVRREKNAPDELRLVLAGGNWGTYGDEIRRVAADNGVADHVLTPGYITNHELNALMSSCLAFAYVSLSEGFGLPPLEAMACGAPVITSNVTSLPEVVGDAGILVSPMDIEGMASALYTLVADPEENRRRRRLSLDRAALFSWERTATLTLKSYEAALNA